MGGVDVCSPFHVVSHRSSTQGQRQTRLDEVKGLELHQPEGGRLGPDSPCL